jgi:hypothetical protein
MCVTSELDPDVYVFSDGMWRVDFRDALSLQQDEIPLLSSLEALLALDALSLTVPVPQELCTGDLRSHPATRP